MDARYACGSAGSRTVKRRGAAGPADDPDRPTHLLGDHPADRQPQARALALGLGREERVEERSTAWVGMPGPVSPMRTVIDAGSAADASPSGSPGPSSPW